MDLNSNHNKSLALRYKRWNAPIYQFCSIKAIVKQKFQISKTQILIITDFLNILLYHLTFNNSQNHFIFLERPPPINI